MVAPAVPKVVRVGSDERESASSASELTGARLVALPVVLLVLGTLIGLPFALTPSVALERLLGLVAAGVLGVAALWGLRHIGDGDIAWVRLGVAAVAVLGSLWIVGADPKVFRGPVGTVLNVVLAPLLGRWPPAEPWEVMNTRFVLGYPGLATLCLVAIFCCGGVVHGWLMGRGKADSEARVGLPKLAMALLLAGAAVVLLLGSGTRGGLLGLAVGLGVIGVLMWRFGWLLAIAAGVGVGGLAALGVLDKGLDVSSASGRLQFWGDYLRLAMEFPLTGVGAGIDTAYRTTVLYEINPDPTGIYYAHNTFVQSYLEGGPLAFLGMVLIPLLALAVAFAARGAAVSQTRRALTASGLALLAAVEVQGFTDQIATTNVGTLILVVALAAVLAGAGVSPAQLVGRWTARIGGALGGAVVVGLVLMALLPAGRAVAYLNLGGLQANRAILTQNSSTLSAAEATLLVGLAADPTQPALQRNLARVQAAQFDTDEALLIAQRLETMPGLDPFAVLQLAHVYRDLGWNDKAYELANRSYGMAGRPAPDAVMSAYRQALVADDFRVRTLADQAEGLMLARRYDEALSLFLQALSFAPGNAYLIDRIGHAERGAYPLQIGAGLQTR